MSLDDFEKIVEQTPATVDGLKPEQKDEVKDAKDDPAASGIDAFDDLDYEPVVQKHHRKKPIRRKPIRRKAVYIPRGSFIDLDGTLNRSDTGGVCDGEKCCQKTWEAVYDMESKEQLST